MSDPYPVFTPRTGDGEGQQHPGVCTAEPAPSPRVSQVDAPPVLDLLGFCFLRPAEVGVCVYVGLEQHRVSVLCWPCWWLGAGWLGAPWASSQEGRAAGQGSSRRPSTWPLHARHGWQHGAGRYKAQVQICSGFGHQARGKPPFFFFLILRFYLFI